MPDNDNDPWLKVWPRAAVGVVVGSKERVIPTYVVSVFSSAAKGNAPHGYLLVRIELIPGQLYAECERNPYTGDEWRHLSFHLGDMDQPGNCSLYLIGLRIADEAQFPALNRFDSVISELLRLLGDVSKLYREEF